MIDNDFSRRRVLQLTAAGLVAAPWMARAAQTGSQVSAEGQPMPRGVSLPDEPPAEPGEDSVGVAVVGLGGFALNQMMPRFGESKCHVAALVSGNRDKARRVATAYGVPEDAIYGYENFDDIASDDRIDAVYIVLPTALHAEYTERAFAAGKHVLTEKPMALSSAECQRMIDAAKRADRKLMVAYRCHFEPYNLRAMQLMEDGAVGPIRNIRTTQTYMASPTTPQENWRFNRALAGGGPLEDYGIYGLQAALYLSGEMPDAISAFTDQPANDPKFEQIFATTGAQLHFPSGAMAQLITSYDAANGNQVLVRGRSGELIMDPATNYSGQVMTLRRGGGEERLDPGDPTVQFAGQLDHFAEAVREGTAIKTPGEMGLRDLRLIEAIYLAAREARRVALAPDGTLRER